MLPEKVIADGIRADILDMLSEKTLLVKSIIMDAYEGLIRMLSSYGSSMDPSSVRDEFESRLGKFEYISTDSGAIDFNVPDEETVDFSNGLEDLNIMIEGVAGVHVELTGEDYLNVFGVAPINYNGRDVYLVEYSDKIKAAEEVLGKKFKVYPLSNYGPFRLFDAAKEKVQSNMSLWIASTIGDLDARYT